MASHNLRSALINIFSKVIQRESRDHFYQKNGIVIVAIYIYTYIYGILIVIQNVQLSLLSPSPSCTVTGRQDKL